jgi:hypothetical protein
MSETRRNTGLRTIFSFFLGLMLTTFVGVGVYTFHPPPTQCDSQIKDLNHREQGIRGSRPSIELTLADREQLQEINQQRSELIDAAEEMRKPWGLSTSIILIVFSTLALVASLVRAEQLPVISNGLLLGGVFTMLYGVGWIAFTGASTARFMVMALAFAITIGLGYVRFTRRGPTASVTDTAELPMGEGLAGIERRVQELEDRVNSAALALGQKHDSSTSS